VSCRNTQAPISVLEELCTVQYDALAWIGQATDSCVRSLCGATFLMQLNSLVNRILSVSSIQLRRLMLALRGIPFDCCFPLVQKLEWLAIRSITAAKASCLEGRKEGRKGGNTGTHT
jgi:hypothetical protein